MAFDLSDLLQKYLNRAGATRPAEVERHYDQVAQHASPQVMKQGIAEALRSDDTPEAIAKRIELYHEQTKPLVFHYRQAGNLVGIHGDRPENEVFAEIQETVEQARVATP